MTRFGKTCQNAWIFFLLIYFLKCYRLPFIWCTIRRYTCSGFDDIVTYALTLRMKFREKQKINNLWTTHALFRVNRNLEMDYKRRLSLSSSPEAQGLLNTLKLLTMVKL